jgi:hypothetical protein
MPASSNPPARNRGHSMEFLIGQHSLFLAGLGQAFFYLHLVGPHLPVWVAGPFFLVPWSIVFILFYHDRPLFSPTSIRRWWLRCTIGSAIFTIFAEAVWVLGYMPPPKIDHSVLSDVFIQILMNLGWLSFIPQLRDHRENSQFWS